MSEFWSQRDVVKTRKPHTCIFCLEEIPKGSSCGYYAGMWENQFYSYYMCNRCLEFISSNSLDLSEGFEGGDYWEYQREVE